MFAGYVQKRTTPISPPPMQRVYSVLWGTLLMDYDSEEESKVSMSPRLCVEVLGVSEWDGKGRANNYSFGFLIVTHTGSTYYVSVPTVQERDEWVLQLKRSLECVFANPEVAPFKPSKILSTRPALASNSICPASKNIVNKASATYCRCCGLAHYAAEHVAEPSTVLQISVEEAERVCLNCRNAQAVILWLKSLNYIHTMALHEGTKSVLQDVRKYKSSFKLRRRLSARLELAADLLEEGKLTAEEFEELRLVDHSYRRELLYEESLKLKGAVDAFGDDMQTIIDVILNSSLIDKGGRWSQYSIILKVLEVADRAPDIVDFYMPQLLQAHLIIAETRTVEALVKLDLFQQALLVMAQKYPSLGLKLCWGLVGTVGDYAEKRCSQVQYAACVALLLQLEMVTTGYVSSIADVPACKLLAGALVGSMHQQQEVGYEIGALCLVRRRLQELNDEDELDRKIRKGLIDPELLDADGNLKPGALAADSKKRTGPLVPSECTCVELLYQLGVGQAGRSRFSDDDSDNTGSDQEEGDSSGSDRRSPDPSNPQGKTQAATKPSSREAVAHRYFGFQAFSEQLDFVQKLNVVVESLRFIDRPLRTKCLLKEVARWNEDPMHELGWDPTTIAGEPFYRIMHIVPSECRVFRTKARAPSMLVCEVLRDDLVPHYLDIVKREKLAAAQKGDGAVMLATVLTTGSGVGGNQTITSPALNRRAPNPIFVSNVDAQTIDASAQDIDVSTVEEDAPARSADHTVAGTPHVSSAGGRANSQDAFAGHDLSAVLAAAEGHSTLKAVHVEREKFATTSRNIDNVTQLISGMSLSETSAEDRAESPSSEGPFLKRGESAMEGERDSPSIVVRAQALGAIPEESGKQAGLPEGSPARAGSRATIMRRASRSVLASNRLSVTKGISEFVRPSGEGGTIPPHLSPSGSNMRMSASGVFSPMPVPPALPAGAAAAGAQPPAAASRESSAMYEDPDACAAGDASFVGDDAERFSNKDDQSTTPTGRDTISSSASGAPAGVSQVTKKVLSSAQRLLASGVIDAAEYELLIASDQSFQDETAREEAVVARNKVEDAFGESWEAKKERILGDRLYMFGVPSEGAWPGWDLRSFIMKSNDDLRQEVCCLQLMQLFKEIFEHFGLQHSLYLRPYRIVSTSSTTGLVQVLEDAMSLDALKKTEGFTTLAAYFQKTYDTSAERYNTARLNFAASLAAYSLFSYLLLIKDRHNGNLMIDADGHILHIDFGFLLSIAPGGSFSLESAPFKLTEEMVEVLGGLDSPFFGEFLTAFTKGFIALQSNAENIVSALQILAYNSSFPCFAGKQASAIIDKLRARFRTELSVSDAVKHCLDLITNSYGHYGTRQYDTFQWMTNGIMP